MFAFCLSGPLAFAQESLAPDVKELQPGDHRACVFADDQAHCSYHAVGNPRDTVEYVDWHVAWSLMAGARTIARGNSKAIVPGLSDVPSYFVEIATPPLRESVVLPVQLSTVWTAGERKYQHNRSLFVFSRNPFAAHRTLLGEAQIKLFDPIGNTAERLDAHEIPYSVLPNLSAIDSTNAGIVLVGEGVSLHEQRQLAETLLLAAQRGLQVLCLAPSEGDFPLTVGEGKQQSRPRRLVFENRGFVQRYDKRFDILPDPPLFSLSPRRDKVVIAAENVSSGWSWLSMEFETVQPKQPAGRLLVCGPRIVARWEIGPVPRYLFIHLIQELTENSFTEEGQ